MKILTAAFAIFVVCMFGGCATPQAPFVPDVAAIESIKHIALIIPATHPAMVRVARTSEQPPSLQQSLMYQPNRSGYTQPIPIQTNFTPTQAAVGNIIAALVIAGIDAGIESGNRTKQEAYTNAVQAIEPPLNVTQEFFKTLKNTFIERGYKVSEVKSQNSDKAALGDADAYLDTRFWHGYFARGIASDYKRFALMSAQLRRTSDQAVLNSIDSHYMQGDNDDYQFGNNEALMSNFQHSVKGLVSLAQRSGEAVINIMTPNTPPKNSTNTLGLTRVFISPYAGEVPKTTNLALVVAPPKTAAADIAKAVIEPPKLTPSRESTVGAEIANSTPVVKQTATAVATPVNIAPQVEAKVIVEPPKTIPPAPAVEPTTTAPPIKVNAAEALPKIAPYVPPPPVVEEKDPLAEYGREVILSEPEPETKPKSKSTPKPKQKPKQ